MSKRADCVPMAKAGESSKGAQNRRDGVGWGWKRKPKPFTIWRKIRSGKAGKGGKSAVRWPQEEPLHETQSQDSTGSFFDAVIISTDGIAAAQDECNNHRLGVCAESSVAQASRFGFGKALQAPLVMDPCEIDWEVPELSFRNATRGFLYQAEASNLPIPLELPLQVLAAFAGLNMHLVVLAEELAVACPTAHSLERFDFICQQVRGSIRDLVTKFPLRLPRAEGLLQEAVENCMNIGLEILHHLLGGLCMQLPSPNQCRESLWCYKLYQRLTKATAEVAVSSHLVQDQLEASVLWQFDAPKAPATLHHHSPPLPQFPSNAEGEVRTQDDLRIKTLSALLRAMGPQDLHMVEVGTHLGHVADGLLSRFPRLHYVGIDPYPGEYDGRPILLGSSDLGDSANFNRTRTRLSRFGSRAQLCRCTSGTVASSHWSSSGTRAAGHSDRVA
ncbi:Uncharacterized protein SCF082_LOCUS17649 [Durusdinium trenchii]|uniref:Uncharacterized protein n=1 Tax=Durusdinium trenchii TaxID=1381693 RepID=A0ABP0KLC6_9DINO